jgi:hypothetical protein
VCIDQADEERKAEQIGIMNFIYGEAWVTLVALCSLWVFSQLRPPKNAP